MLFGVFVIPDGPTRGSFEMAFHPPSVPHAQTRYTIQGSLHATRPGGFKRAVWGVEPHIDTACKKRCPTHIVVLYINDRNRIAECGCGRRDFTNDRFSRLVFWM